MMDPGLPLQRNSTTRARSIVRVTHAKFAWRVPRNCPSSNSSIASPTVTTNVGSLASKLTTSDSIQGSSCTLVGNMSKMPDTLKSTRSQPIVRSNFVSTPLTFPIVPDR